jgi:hypothetical protein
MGAEESSATGFALAGALYGLQHAAHSHAARFRISVGTNLNSASLAFMAGLG